MNIVFDLRVTSGDWSGIAVYSLNLVEALLKHYSNDLKLHLLFQSEREEKKYITQIKNKALFSHHLKSSVFPFGIYQPKGFLPLRRLLSRIGNVDLFFTPQFFSPFGLLGKPVVCVIHDLIPMEYPHLLEQSKKAKWKRIFKICTYLALRFSKRTLVDSHYTHSLIERFFNSGLSSKCSLVYPVLDSNHWKGVFSDKKIFSTWALEKYILYVGRQDPYKNLPRLIEAYKLLMEKGYSGKLVLAGRVDPRYPEVGGKIQELALEGRVITTDFISNEQLKALYEGCDFVVQPSLSEGFGLTALEPLLFNKFCVASKQGSIPEVLGSHGVYFDPLSVDEIVGAMNIALSLPSPNEEALKDHLSLFSSTAVAASWMDVMRQVVSG